MNLVLNASEAIERQGTVAIKTANRYLDEPLKGYEDVQIGEYVLLTVSDTGSGIYLDNSANGTIYDNDFQANYNSIYLWSNCDNNTISNNRINASTQNGIVLRAGSNDNLIIRNNITDSIKHGIWTRFTSANITITQNIIKNNNY